MLNLIAGVAGCCLLALAAYKDNSRPPIVSTGVETMAADKWDIQHSPGMLLRPLAGDGGWYFDFPGSAGSVGYVTTLTSMAASSGIAASIMVVVTGNPVFNYKLEANNTCDFPAHVRLFLQRQGDDLSGVGPKQYFRWWSIEAAFKLKAGEAMLTESFANLDKWVSVFGKRGDADAEATAGLQDAVRNLARIGFTFGGGCFYGHGVNITNGSARFIATSFNVK